MSDEKLVLLLVAFVLVMVGALFYWKSLPTCHQEEYQDLNGTHQITVCEDK